MNTMHIGMLSNYNHSCFMCWCWCGCWLEVMI